MCWVIVSGESTEIEQVRTVDIWGIVGKNLKLPLFERLSEGHAKEPMNLLHIAAEKGDWYQWMEILWRKNYGLI